MQVSFIRSLAASRSLKMSQSYSMAWKKRESELQSGRKHKGELMFSPRSPLVLQWPAMYFQCCLFNSKKTVIHLNREDTLDRLPTHTHPSFAEMLASHLSCSCGFSCKGRDSTGLCLGSARPPHLRPCLWPAPRVKRSKALGPTGWEVRAQS